MPYFITDTAEGCSGWATIKDDGEVIGCHTNKQDAIDQMVAVSLAEDMEPGGERKKHKKAKPMKTMYRELPENYRPALAEDVPEGRACGNCHFYDESRQNAEGTKAWCEQWDEFVDGAYYCNAWQPHDESDDMDEERAPAPAKDQIKGSDTNKEGSASGAGGNVDFDEKTETALRNKVTTHNEDMDKADKPAYTRTTLGQLKAVYRRGSGAYSTSHRPGISRAAWSMARVNAFLYLLRNGRPENANYVTDNDLLPKGHPKSTRSLDENRDINQDAPAYMRAAARRGLEYYSDGKGGSGLVEKTIREARLMAQGQVSDDKWIRTAAWIARHLDDLDSPDADPSSGNYPSAGVVAHLLWGSGPSKTKARAAMRYAQGVAEKIRNEERHLQGKHDQKSHGSGGKSTGIPGEAGKGNIKITSDMAADFQGGSAAPHLRQKPDGSYEFTPERQALHDKIVADAVAGVPNSADPTYYVMGGGPAAGKSTMLKDSKVSIPSKDKAVQVNPDDVKEKLPEWDRMQGDTNRAAYTHEESSYISKRIQAAAFETNRDVVADGTGDSSVSSMSNKIKKARDANYRVVGNYATVPTQVAIDRANARGARTGRYVPESVIRGTHAGVSDVLPKIVSQFDEINLFDTTGDLVLLASGKNGKFTVNNQDGYNAFLAKAGE